MAVLSREDFMEAVRTRIGEDTSDEAIAFLENVTDTIEDYETRVNGDGTDWRAEAERIDKEWREKYIARFNSPVDNKEDDVNTEDDEIKVKTYDDLFKTEE